MAAADVQGGPGVLPKPRAALLGSDLPLVDVMPGTTTSRVRRGMCRSPAEPCGATATAKSVLGLHLHTRHNLRMTAFAYAQYCAWHGRSQMFADPRRVDAGLAA